MGWNINNSAHRSLWQYERFLVKQLNEKFSISGDWTVDYLIGLAVGDSPAMRREKIKTHAILLDQVFISIYSAIYEDGIDSFRAVSDMVTALSDAGKTMKDLGEVIDGAYRFHGEE